MPADSTDAPGPAASGPLPPGTPAPDFSLPHSPDGRLRLSDLRGQPVVLAFYPADWSGGCTKEICALRDNIAELAKLNAEVIGISGDYVYSHHEWAKFHSLPFILASDHKHEIAARFKCFNETAGFNKRAVYLIDMKGKIAYIDLTYSTKDLSSFTKLQDALTQLQ